MKYEWFFFGNSVPINCLKLAVDSELMFKSAKKNSTLLEEKDV